MKDSKRMNYQVSSAQLEDLPASPTKVRILCAVLRAYVVRAAVHVVSYMYYTVELL